jgi:hypothetical protein
MRKSVFALAVLPLVIVALGTTSASDSSAADPPSAAPVNPGAPAVVRTPSGRDADDDGTPSRARSLRGSMSDASKKLAPILKADPRTAPLVKELLEAAKITDQAQRKAKLTALGPRAVALRTDAFKKAGLNPADMEAKASALQRQMTEVVKVEEPAPPPPPGSVITTTTVTSFPLTHNYRSDCPDSNDKVDFDGSVVKVDAKSTPVDDDCWHIRGGRGATFQVPAETKKIKVAMKAKVDLDLVATHLGYFAEATGTLGIRVHSPSGATLINVPLPGGSTIPSPVFIKNTKKIHAKNVFPNPVPFDTASFTDQLQDGESGSTATFTFPGNPGPSLNIVAFVGGWVDADISGVSILNNDITLQELKVTFYR